MKYTITSIASLVFILMIACKPSHKTSQNQGQEWINKAIKTHGGKLYNQSAYQFDFRGKTYQFLHQNQEFSYSVTTLKNTDTLCDVLQNNNFYRSINGTKVVLSEKEKNSYFSSLNSVIYFALLPYKLNDAAVRKNYIGSTYIRQQPYKTIQVTFTKEGGGEDYEDVFYYWIHSQEHTVDYLAYKYHTNGGGIRFREAYNRRSINGIIFQDYINYKADLQSKMSELGKLLEQNKLKEVSRIELKNIQQLH